MKKITSLILVMLMMVGLFSVTALAEGEVVVTKSPTSETVQPGGSALFIAKADNATEINWCLYWRGSATMPENLIYCTEASKEFPGLKVEGLGTENLTLINIPSSLNGWYVIARFKGEKGTAESLGAKITVLGAQAETPTITAQPVGATLEAGGSTTLNVSATTSGNNTLAFQWYKNSINGTEGATPITGATNSSYTPQEIAGTTYYYVSVTSSNGGETSTAAVSNVVAVTYPEQQAQPVEPSPTPGIDQPGENQGTDEPAAETDTPTEPEVTPTAANVSEQRTENALKALSIAAGAVVLLAVAGGITALLVRSRRVDDESEDASEEE